MRITSLLLAIVLCFALQLPARAEESPATKAEEILYPGPGELALRATQLNNEASESSLQASRLAQFADLDQRIATLQQQLQELRQAAALAGPLDQWFSSGLRDFRKQIEQHGGQVNKLLQELTERINRLNDLRRDWQTRENYWQAWKNQLLAAREPFPEEAHREALQKITTTLKSFADATAPLLAAQVQLLAHEQRLSSLQQQFDTALAELKTSIFQKNHRSLFNRTVLTELRQVRYNHSGLTLLKIAPAFLLQNGGLILAQVLLVILLSMAIIRSRRDLEATSEWDFFYNHPLATGVFTVVPALSIFYLAPPPAWQLLQGVLGVFAATVLVSATVINPRRRTVVYLIASIFTLSLVLKIIAIPTSYYRIYLVLLCLLGTPWLWWYGQRNRQARQQMTVFTAYLRLGATLMFLALLALVSGYTTLGTLLVEATLETVIVVLFVNMANRLTEGAVAFLVNLPFLKERTFFRQHGEELTERLKTPFKIIIFSYALIHLLTAWRVFDTVGAAFHSLLNFNFTFSEFRFSVQMALLIWMVLYVSLLVSWLLRCILDDQYFPRQEFDRGVRDAIKKLLHYSLILFGFLLAASLAGIELSNFAVLAGAFGIGIGFGLQDIVNNFVSGLILLFERPVKVGDGVLIDGDYGSVVKIGLRSTVVETLDQAELIVPNSQMISQKVTNWTLSTRRVRLVVPVGVAYGSDLEQVLAILFEAGQQHPEVLEAPQPSPIFVQFGESSLDFELRVWVSDIDKRPQVRSGLLLAIDKRFREAGVEIPFPQRDLHLRSVAGNILGKFDQQQDG